LVVIWFAGCTALTNWKSGPGAAVQAPTDLRFEVARIAERSGKLTEARDGYLQILNGTPDHGPTLHRLGVVLLRLEEGAKGVEYMQRAVELGHNSIDTLGDLGYAQYLIGDLGSASATLMEAVKREPTNKRLVNNLATVVGFQGKHHESLELFRRVNTEAESLANLGFVLSQTGDLKNAKAHLHKALDLDPNLRKAANGLLEIARLEQQQISTGEPRRSIPRGTD
jgi:Flp pilus assembly protein TadD